MAQTKIDWCDKVWNPTTGCTKISAGCKNCYAERMAKRLQAMGQERYQDGFAVRCHPDALDIPTRWKKPAKIFVDSMSDLFHDDVEVDFIWQVWRVMRAAPQHTFIILTKRPQRAWHILATHPEQNFRMLPNVWLGVSVENQQAAYERIPWLLNTPAAVRFVSIEPMLEQIDLAPYINNLDWVICGSESGPKRRPFEMSWAENLLSQCITHDVPFFFKQAQVNGKIIHMPELYGSTWEEFPEV